MAFDSVHGEPGSAVTVQYQGELTVVTLGANGWWGFAAMHDVDFNAIPELVEQ